MESSMQQLDLVTVPLESVNLIEASAGTGKTYTISNLYLRFILEKQLVVNEILVVTFTEAATKELRERLRLNLDEAYGLLCEPDLDEALKGGSHVKIILRNYIAAHRDKLDEARKRLRLAVVSFDEAAIFTIHGFCQRMLNENAFESSLPFDLEVVTDDSDIRQQIVHDYWRKLVLTDDPITKQFLFDGTLSLGGLAELAGSVTKQSDLVVGNSVVENEHAIDELVADAKDCWLANRDDILSLLNDKGNKLSRGPYKAGDLERDAEYLDGLADGEIPVGQINKFAKSTLDAAITGAQQAKGVTAYPHPFFDLCDKLNSCITNHQLAIKHDVVNYLKHEFPVRKKKLNVQCFEDILLNLRAALKLDESGRLHDLIRTKFKAAMIDEFQDTDPVQYEIFQRVFIEEGSGQTVFLIGDPKQSIYQFRGADIFAYLKAKRIVDTCWTLDTNFRSEKGMIDAVNHLFIQEDGADLSELNPFLEQDIPYQHIKAGGMAEKNGRLLMDGAAPLSRLQLLNLSNVDTYNAEPGRIAATEATARQIVELVNAGKRNRAVFESDKGKQAQLQPSDIAILVRSHKEAQRMQKQLRDYGVPSVLQSSGNVLHSEEAEHLFYFMAAVASPGEYSLRPFLTTPFSNKSLLELKSLSDSELQDWYQVMLELQQTWLKYGFMSMFRRFMVQEEIREKLLATENGERAVTNLLHLADLIHKQSINRKLGIEGILTWFNEKITHPEEKPEYEIYLERDADAVRIITVHSSKGLEFNIVFCPFEWGRKYVPWWVKDAQSLQYYDRDTEQWKLDIHKNGPDWNKHIQDVYRAALAENLRLLYVGLTRARNICYLVTGDLTDCHQSALNYLLKGKDFPDIESYLDYMNPSGYGSKSEKASRLVEMGEAAQELSASSKGLIGIQTLMDQELTSPFTDTYFPEKQAKIQLNPAILNNCIETSWGVGSFTWLTKNISHGHKQAEPIKEREDTEEDTTPSAKEAPEPLTTLLPKGARTGSAVHEMFEDIDFTSLDNAEEIIQSKLRKYGITNTNQPNFEEVVSHTYELIQNVLTTPIPQADNLVLNTVTTERRINELEFFYPISDISPDTLAGIFRAHGKDVTGDEFAEQMDRLTFTLKNGFMGGFIDLLFEHNGRYYVLDWKTNWLGNNTAAFTQGAVDSAMLNSYYILQYHLYAVAAHHYLKSRIPDYSFNTHFGGAIYTFVRGMVPERPGHAVFFDRPSENLMSGLCQALGMEA